MNWLERFWFGCGCCRGSEHCPMTDVLPPEGEQVRGFWLVLPVILVFLVPPVTAILGAWIADGLAATRSPLYSGLSQLAGVAVGFALGVLLARLLSGLARRRDDGRKRA